MSPHIRQKNRERALHSPITTGELAYCITKVCVKYLKCKDRDFDSMNAVVGVLDVVKDQFKKRILDPYEAEKATENGDAWTEEDGENLEWYNEHLRRV